MDELLNEAPAAAEHEFGPTAVHFQAHPDLLREGGIARPGIDVEELGVLIGELRGGQVEDFVECAGHLPVHAYDEARDLPRVVAVELGLDWSGRARR